MSCGSMRCSDAHRTCDGWASNSNNCGSHNSARGNVGIWRGRSQADLSPECKNIMEANWAATTLMQLSSMVETKEMAFSARMRRADEGPERRADADVR